MQHSKPASLLHWFEVNAVALVPAQPAAQLIGFVSLLLSFPLFFFNFLSWLPLPPSPSSNSRLPSQLPYKTGLMEAEGGHVLVWILPWGAGGFIPGYFHCQIKFWLPFLLSAGMAFCLSERRLFEKPLESKEVHFVCFSCWEREFF